jgi:hypothetical protein
MPPVHFALVILEMGVSQIYLLQLASNLDPPNLSLPHSWDYRCEPLVSSCVLCIKLISSLMHPLDLMLFLILILSNEELETWNVQVCTANKS